MVSFLKKYYKRFLKLIIKANFLEKFKISSGKKLKILEKNYKKRLSSVSTSNLFGLKHSFKTFVIFDLSLY
jgi:hypothetical protein